MDLHRVLKLHTILVHLIVDLTEAIQGLLRLNLVFFFPNPKQRFLLGYYDDDDESVVYGFMLSIVGPINTVNVFSP